MKARGAAAVERRAARAITQRDFDAAVALLEGAIQRDGEDGVSLTMLAQCHEWRGDHRRAVGCAERVLAVEPDEPMNLRLVARCCVRLGEPGRAYVHICRALEEPPAPAPTPSLSARVRSWVLARVPLPRRLRARIEPASAHDDPYAEWRIWAKQWKAAFEVAHRAIDTEPTLH